MKRFTSFFISLTILAISLPSFAIDGNTHILPLVGETSERANEYIDKKIDLIPIKLPKKINRFELLEAERALIPNILKDEISLWSSPLRTKVRDLAWMLPAGGILTALFLVDNNFSQVLTDNHNLSRTQRDISKSFANTFGYPTIFGLPGGILLLGAVTKNDKLREIGILQYESLVDAGIIGFTTQRIFGRNKPNNDKKGRGEFFEGGTSFPSGHATAAWTLASVISHEYSEKKWVPIVSYSLATLFSSARVVQGTHFPSDAVAGALIGYLVGKYVVKHHSEKNKKSK